MKRPSTKTRPLVIVGLGASAGGLEALQLFLSNLPAEQENIAYVVVQHLSPTHKSMMVELLSRETSFDVLEIKNGLLPKANTIYITPPDRDVFLQNGLFELRKPPETWVGPKPSVDKFFISLAQEQKERAVGVILSGTGSDGSQGIRAIKAEGGITIAQDPGEAKYDGMPISAIKTKSVDSVLSGKEIANEIIHLLRYPKSIRVEKAKENELHTIFDILEEYVGIDFSQYKKSTITRRIERRMAAIKATTLENYIGYLKENKEEIELLYKDMLIGVTAFFRDKEPFEALAEAIKEYVSRETFTTNEAFRVWVPACATGEEAYSIAIILDENLRSHNIRHIKIFATDIDEEAVQKAREGIYPEVAISNLSHERIQRYFVQIGNEYEVKPFLKERVIFSRHDITIDPPFVNLDLISCRNLLIYFEGDLQKRIFATFAYALKPHALLLLGKSEAVGAHTDLFSTQDTKNKLFQARTTTESRKTIYPQMVNIGKFVKPVTVAKRRRTGTIEDAIRDTVYEYYEQKCVVIDDNFNIHFIKGNLNDLLTIPSGEMRNNILKMLPDGLSLEVRSLVYRSNKEAIEDAFPVVVERVEHDRIIKIKLTPLEGYAGNYLYFLLCFEIEPINNTEEMQIDSYDGTNTRMVHLEQELMATREHLQTVVEELETSNEELQSSNEELQASNEELQASNEELETTNEELQSTNEELQTAYAEIRSLYEKQNLQKASLEDRAKELSGLKEELDIQYAYIKEVLDAESNIVIVTNGYRLISVNNAFHQFFTEYKTLEEFTKDHDCICELFEKIDEEGFIYDKKQGINWVQLLLDSDRTDLKVRIFKKDIPHTFHVMANLLNGNEMTYVVTLTDISEIDIAKQKLRKELSDEIQHKVSSSRILNHVSTIFGTDILVHEVLEKFKKPLNRINQLYYQMYELLESSEISNSILRQFQQEKEYLLHDIAFMNDFFVDRRSEAVNVYSTIEQLSLLLTQSKNTFLEIEMLGDQNVQYNDRTGQFSYLTLLWLNILVQTIVIGNFKRIKFKVEVKKVETDVIIRITNTGEISICQQLQRYDTLKLFDNENKHQIADAFYLFRSLVKDAYKGNFYSDPDYCEITLR